MYTRTIRTRCFMHVTVPTIIYNIYRTRVRAVRVLRGTFPPAKCYMKIFFTYIIHIIGIIRIILGMIYKNVLLISIFFICKREYYT